MPGIPENITIAGRTPATIKGNLPPLIDTAEAARGGYRAGDDSGDSAPAGILLSESFDDLPDFTSDSDLPADFGPWDEKRQGSYENWSPGQGDADKNAAFQITGADPEKLRGGTGKSFVGWRESQSRSDGTAEWNSDGILSSATFEGSKTAYCRFYIKFQPEWTLSGQSKLFRISAYDGGGRFGFGTSADDSHGPILFWDYADGGIYGVRNFIALRGGPNTSNYFFGESGDPPNLPRSMNQGDLGLNWGVNVTSPGGGHTNPPYISKVTGEAVEDVATHEEIYGTDWNKIEFYLEMNSSPGVADGVLKQWVNDVQTFRNVTMPWVAESGSENMLWNCVMVGGNDNFNAYPDSDKHEEWYAIDDVLVSTDLPEGLV